MKKPAAKKPAPKKPDAPAAAPAPADARRRILIVDDHPFMRAGLAQLIDRQADLVVCGEAGNPAEALLRLAAGGVDLVLSDMTMPGKCASRTAWSSKRLPVASIRMLLGLRSRTITAG